MATLIEIVFVGTGTSAGVPNINCLTHPSNVCTVCRSAITPEGKKNMRRNTAMVVRFRRNGDKPTDRVRNILIDCGKTFYASAIEIFSRYGIRKLDGVILTHGHADAMNGIDDLRQWTLHGAIQKNIDIYLSPETMDTVSSTFPYLVDSIHATGGGDVATFKYHIFDPKKSFSISGLDFTPLKVHHGIYFTTGQPYLCYGFQFGGVSYISDTNFIPPETMDQIKQKSRVFVVDCLREKVTHASHFALHDSIDAAREVRPLKTYLVGFAHRLDHYKMVEDLSKLAVTEHMHIGPAFDGLRVDLQDKVSITESSYIDQHPTVISPIIPPK
ncbi:beta-lactamase-like protein [Phycomyces nitens]|nr:beta-lactamase-like protein [Phycomyces nitens]